jgi:hypothetical protein
VRAGHLKPLGRPALNARKWFETVEIERMSCDLAWLDKAIRIVEKEIQEMNAKEFITLIRSDADGECNVTSGSHMPCPVILIIRAILRCDLHPIGARTQAGIIWSAKCPLVNVRACTGARQHHHHFAGRFSTSSPAPEQGLRASARCWTQSVPISSW